MYFLVLDIVGQFLFSGVNISQEMHSRKDIYFSLLLSFALRRQVQEKMEEVNKETSIYSVPMEGMYTSHLSLLDIMDSNTILNTLILHVLLIQNCFRVHIPVGFCHPT